MELNRHESSSISSEFVVFLKGLPLDGENMMFLFRSSFSLFSFVDKNDERKLVLYIFGDAIIYLIG